MTVNTLVEKLWQRDESVIKDINNEYGRLLHKLAYNIIHSRQDAEECVNDTMLDIWDTIPPEKPESILSYACMIVRRRAIDRVRYFSAEKRGGTEYDLSLSELEDCIADDNLENMDSNELSDAINGFLGEIPYIERNIFMSRYYGFESSSQIANKHNMSVNAVNIRLSRIRNKLKSYLSKRGYVHEKE